MSGYNKNTDTEQMFGGGILMTVSIFLKTLFEVALVAFALWALFNEDKFIAFEEKIKAKLRRRRLRVVRQEVRPEVHFAHNR